MPCLNFCEYSYILTPKNTPPKSNVSTIQPLALEAWLSLAASSARTTVTLEQISTNVLNAPIGSLKCTSCGNGRAIAPKTRTMYVPMSPAKNMISVERNSHRHVLPFGIGSAGWYLKRGGGCLCTHCFLTTT